MDEPQLLSSVRRVPLTCALPSSMQVRHGAPVTASTIWKTGSVIFEDPSTVHKYEAGGGVSISCSKCASPISVELPAHFPVSSSRSPAPSFARFWLTQVVSLVCRPGRVRLARHSDQGRVGHQGDLGHRALPSDRPPLLRNSPLRHRGRAAQVGGLAAEKHQVGLREQEAIPSLSCSSLRFSLPLASFYPLS